MTEHTSKKKVKQTTELPEQHNSMRSTIFWGIGFGLVGLGIIWGLLIPHLSNIRLYFGFVTLTPTVTPTFVPTQTPSQTAIPPTATATLTVTPTLTQTSLPAISFPNDDAQSGIIIFELDEENDSTGILDQLINKLSESDVNIYRLSNAIDLNLPERDRQSETLALGLNYNATIAIFQQQVDSEVTIVVDSLVYDSFDEATKLGIPLPNEFSDLSLAIIDDSDLDYVVNYVLGYLSYLHKDYKSSFHYFNQAESFMPAERIKEANAEALYYYRAFTKYKLNRPNEASVGLHAAYDDYQLAVELNPHLGAAYYYLGFLGNRFAWYEEALNNLNQAVNLHRGFALARYYRGIVYTNLNQYTDALSDFEQVIALKPAFTNARFQRADVLLKMNNTNAAIADYDSIIEIDPTSPVAYVKRGLTYIRLGDIEQAIRDFSLAIEADPKYAEAYNHRGLIYYDIGKHDNALFDFTTAIDANSDFADPYYNRGRIYMERSNNQDADLLLRAQSDFTQAIDLGMETPYLLRGVANYYLENYEQSLSDLMAYQAFLEPLPDEYQHLIDELSTILDSNTFVWIQAMATFDAGEHEGSIPYFDKYILANPNDVDAYGMRGIAYIRSWRPQYAKPDLDRAIELGTENVDVYYWRGYARFQLDDELGSIDDFTLVIALDPGYKRAYYQRAVQLWQLGGYGRNSEYLRRAIDDLTHLISLGDYIYYGLRAEIYLNMGDYESALSDYESYEDLVGPLHPKLLKYKKQAIDALATRG